MQTSAMKACFQIAECLNSSAKILLFFQKNKYRPIIFSKIRENIMGEGDKKKPRFSQIPVYSKLHPL